VTSPSYSHSLSNRLSTPLTSSYDKSNPLLCLVLAAISAVLRLKSSELGEAMCFSACYVPLLLFVWLAWAAAAWLIQNSFSGQLKRWMSRRGQAYSYQPLNAQKGQNDVKAISQQRTFSYPDALEFNFFDPDNLPEMMQPYAEAVFSTVQSLAKQYGFQVDNSRNQAEHLLMMLTNESSPSDSNLSGAAARLHSKIFANYRKWCDRMGTPPLFLKRSNGKAYAAYVEDALVYLLVWGEAANLKHAPECLCFLYHKTMQEHIINSSRGVSPSTYPGYFLDMVVTPIYDVIAESLKKSGDNEYKKTYDDFNEFFWSPSCMRYKIHDNAEDAEAGVAMQGGGLEGDDVHVARGMQAATKTYLEKRSWLHPLLSVHRVFEWHTITFTLLMAWAFSNQLIWTYAFTFQVASFIFWEITFLSLIWTCLEVQLLLDFCMTTRCADRI
jgi:1,3-beta-glucan synthase subunit FKS1, domain-1